MKLIIAEKPSLGRNIAAAIGNMKQKNGYLEGGDYLITWVFGHLFSLADIAETVKNKVRTIMKPKIISFFITKKSAAADFLF